MTKAQKCGKDSLSQMAQPEVTMAKKQGFVKKAVKKVKEVAESVKDEAEDSWDKTRATKENVEKLYRKAERWASRRKRG